MTAPIPEKVRGELPEPGVCYEVDGIRFGDVDDDGCWWIVEKTEGWHEPPGFETARSKRPGRRGSRRSRSTRKERVITLQGWVLCPGIEARLTAQDRIAAMCADGTPLHQFTATDQLGRQRTAMVELDGDPKYPTRNERRFDFQLRLAAPDPRKHDARWQHVVSRLPGQPVGGLNPQVGLDGAQGLDPGANVNGDQGNLRRRAIGQVANYGTAPAYPVFEVRGPLSRPEIRDLARGVRIVYGDHLDDGETLRINCDVFPQLGLGGHAVVSSRRGRVKSLIRGLVDYPQVDPREVRAFQLYGAGSDPALLTTSLRSAWE